jgi:hypothetical protein
VAFPQTPLEVLIELFVSGAWTDITADVYTRDGIHISRGRSDYGQRTDPTTCTLTLNNRSGTYSPRNPLSPYYGLIGRNTPIRVSVLAGSVFLDVPEDAFARATTVDHADLDITGDIDVRADLTPTGWTGSWDNTAWEVMGKYNSSTNQRSWRLLVNSSGHLVLGWSTTGSDLISATSTSPVPFGPGQRGAVRATLDVNNGSGGYTVTFYTAPTLGGSWGQLGDPVVTTSGTTSIFNSTAALEVGDIAAVGFHYLARRYHAVEVRNGIGGTAVANPDFTAQAAGTTSFADAAGRTWTLSGAQITNRRPRFEGEVSAWPARWDVSGNDVYVPLEAAGILRRLGQGQKALDSTLRRRVPSYGPLAYWPMEEGASATSASSPVVGVNRLKLTQVTWAGSDGPASSNPLPVLASSGSSLPQMLGRVPAPASTPTSWSVQYIYRLDNANTTLRTFMRTLSTGTVAEWYIQQRNNLSRIFGLDSDGATVFTQDIATGTSLYNDWIWVRLTATQNGGNVDWGITWFNVGGSSGGFSASFAGTVGRPTGVASPPDGYSADLDGMALGHISAFPVDITAAYTGAIDAWAGEAAGSRMTRLAEEESLSLTQLGDTGLQERVGPQHPDTVLSLIESAADADGGILYERRDTTGLAYRDRISLYNQAPVLELDYTSPGHIAPPLEPVDDDQQVRNDITVQREDGSSARAVLEEGPLSTQAPPDGVGVYDESVTLNLYDDDQPAQHAGWRLHLGTWDETRYPVVRLDLAAAPELIDAATALDSGSRTTIADLPAWLPPGPADLLVQGYTETIGHPIDWDLALTCVPYAPYNVAALAVYEDFEDTAFEVTATNGGNLPWARSTAHFNTGGWSLRSGAISNNQTSDWIVTIPPGSTEMQFWYWTSSENSGPGFEGDRLLVLVDGVQILRAQGTTGWTQAIADVTGKSTVTFRYAKDNSTASGEDAVHIDDLAFTGIAPTRADTDASELAASIDADDTSLSVAVTDGPLWVTSATFPQEFPFTVRVGGEDMTVTAVTGTSSPQTFTVTRSANGIVKVHASGDDLRLAIPAITAL